MASIYDLYIEQGSDFSQSLNASGDFTGWTISGKYRDSTGSEGSDIVSWTDDSEGEFDISISDTVTSSMSSGVGYYDIEVIDLEGNVDRILQGRIYVDGEV